MNRKAFTLIEILIVVIIIGILASIALPQFSGMKKKALDKEAIANLKLIRAGQKIYKMETGSYANCLGAWDSDQETCINNALKLSLPPGGPTDNPNWDYETYGSSGCTHCKSLGSRGGDRDNRVWHLHISGHEEPESGNCH